MSTTSTAKNGSGGSSTKSIGHRHHEAVCAFWIGAHCFGVSVTMVAEVVEVDSVTEVPLAPDAVLGIFNLRGTPVPMLNIVAAVAPGAEVGTKIGLVVRWGDALVALAIDRMDGVVPAGIGNVVLAGEGDSNKLVVGFLEVPGRATAITLLATDGLLAHIDGLRMQHGAAN